MRQSKTTIKELTKRYRAVLLKCVLFNAVLFFGTGTANALSISDGFYDDIEEAVEDELQISGGTFNDVEYYTQSGNGTLVLTGGTFTGETEFDLKDITISGGTFNSSQLEFEASNTLNINSDDASFVQASGIKPFLFQAGTQLNITGEKGLGVSKTIVSAPSISGKIIGNNQSFIGNFGGSADRWIVGNKTLYSTWIDDMGSDVTFDRANLTLNGNAVAGTGNYMWEITGTGDPDISSVSLKNIPALLTDDEIDNSVNATMAEVRRINGSTKNAEDMATVYWDILEVPFASGELEEFIEAKWEAGNALTPEELEDVETALRNSYADYNTALEAFSADVTLTGSSVTMNNTSTLANYSFADTKGNIVVDDSTVTANGTNLISALNGEISFTNDSVLSVNQGAILNIASKDGGVSFDNTSSLNLSGTLNGSVSGGTVDFNSASAKVNGALSGTINLNFNDDYFYSNINAAAANINTVTIASGKTLDIGENTLNATNITGGTIKLSLPSTEVSSAIINATSATGVSLDVDMSKVSRENAVHYVLTATNTGYTLANVNNNRYAFSTGTFSLEDYKADPTSYAFDAGWAGGDLYILRLATAGEAAVEDLRNSGVSVSVTEEKAIAGLSDEIVELLAPAQKAVAEKINSLLDQVASDVAQVKQILREIAPEAAPSASSTASANAGAVMNVVSGRMGGGVSAARGSSHGGKHGRSGGDYTSGALSAWAQGMFNKAELRKTDGFDSDSTGFAAGFEYNVNDSVKVGIGYAFTDTDISTDRSETGVDTHTGFVYGEYKPENLYVNGTLSYGHSKYDETTKLTGLNSEYSADTFAGQLMTGYTFGNLTPETGLRYVSVRQKSYTDALGARMADKTLDTWTWVGGVKASKSFLVGKTTVTPDAKIMATYDFARDGQSRTVTLANGSAYVAEGDNMKRFGLEAGVGLSVNVGDKTDIELSYEGKFKEHYTDHTGLINIKYHF